MCIFKFLLTFCNIAQNDLLLLAKLYKLFNCLLYCGVFKCILADVDAEWCCQQDVQVRIAKSLCPLCLIMACFYLVYIKSKLSVHSLFLMPSHSFERSAQNLSYGILIPYRWSCGVKPPCTSRHCVMSVCQRQQSLVNQLPVVVLVAILGYLCSLILHFLFRSTPPSRPNKAGFKCPYVLHPQNVSLISMKCGM